LTVGLLAVLPMTAQEPAFSRKPSTPVSGQPIERGADGFFGDFFRLGKPGEVWMIESVRLWFLPARGPSCGRELGDSIEKITLLGALDNPPIPGQPTCDCHALIPLATVLFDRGSSQPKNAGAKLVAENGMWRIDLPLRWSIPAASDAIYSLRATPRGRSGCPVATGWSLATAPAPAGHRLHVLDKKGVPAGLAQEETPRAIAIEVWANSWK
jgi:hypothetical protein